MKQVILILTAAILLVSSCTSQKKLAFLNNLPEPNSEETFTMDIPDYKLQPRDILSITAKAMTAEGNITEYLAASSLGGNQQISTGFVVNKEGNIVIPAVGTINVAGLTLDETRRLIQTSIEKVFKNSTVECNLLSFKYTVIGMVNKPGTYINTSDYLTVFEAIGQAGGLDDFGDRHRILIIRTSENETTTFSINLQDKKILSSNEYFILPNDILIVQPRGQKIFNLNLPTISFILTTVTSTLTIALLLNNFLGN